MNISTSTQFTIASHFTNFTSETTEVTKNFSRQFTLNGLLFSACTAQINDQIVEFLSEMIFPSVVLVAGHSGKPILHSVNVTVEVLLREAKCAFAVMIEADTQISQTSFMKVARCSLGALISHIESDRNNNVKTFHPLDLVKIY